MPYNTVSHFRSSHICTIVMRLGKPMEHAQAAVRAALAPGVAVEQITTIGRQLSYFGYLFHDTLVWVCPWALNIAVIFLTSSQANTVKFYNLKPSTSARVSKLANQFWLSGILFSITFGLLKVRVDDISMDLS